MGTIENRKNMKRKPSKMQENIKLYHHFLLEEIACTCCLLFGKRLTHFPKEKQLPWLFWINKEEHKILLRIFWGFSPLKIFIQKCLVVEKSYLYTFFCKPHPLLYERKCFRFVLKYIYYQVPTWLGLAKSSRICTCLSLLLWHHKNK